MQIVRQWLEQRGLQPYVEVRERNPHELHPGSPLNRALPGVLALVGCAAAAILLAALSWLLTPLPISAGTDDAATRLRALVEAARERMAERVEPPVSRMPFLCLAERSRSAPVREYVLSQQAEALEALLAT